jgi:hypothetical protein
MSGIEKRKHIRFSAMGPVQVLVQDQKPQEGYLASIGRGGLGLYLLSEVQATQLILVNLRLVEQQPGEDELRVVARVAWACRAGRLFMAGLAFEQMSDVRFNRLLQHLHIIEAWQLGDRSSERAGGGIRFSVKD